MEKYAILFLDKVRSFRHFIHHGYDCELEKTELLEIQRKLITHEKSLNEDFTEFRRFVEELSN